MEFPVHSVSNTWKQLLSSQDIQRYVKQCANAINKKFKGQKIVVACILKGAAYFHVDLTRHLTLPHSSYFIEASSYKNEQTQSEQVEILSLIHPSKFKDRKVILIDELYDNGKTLAQVKEAIIQKAEIRVEDVFTCTLFQKNKTTRYPLPDLVGIKIPDVWVVGYGLDDQQEKRNWVELWACPKGEGVELTEDDKRVFKD